MTDDAHPPHPAGAFQTTRWSVVREAAAGDEQSRDALGQLCESYWYPLYVFVRRSGYGSQDARDLTQGFFARLLDKRDFDTADPERGRFRSYLLAAMKHYLANERARERTARRGGGQRLLSLDFDDAEHRWSAEPRDEATPEQAFLRRWVLELIARATGALAEEYGARGQRSTFERLRPLLAGNAPDVSREALAKQLDMSETALNVALHRLRSRFRERLRREVRETLDRPDRVQDELDLLLAALAGR